MTNGTSKPKHLLYRDMQMMGTFQIKSEENYVDLYEPPSPTDSSEDSVEVKVGPILSRNKRKCADPRKVPENFGPLKKRICLKNERHEVAAGKDCPFRPWNVKEEQNFGGSYGSVWTKNNHLQKEEDPTVRITPNGSVSDCTTIWQKHLTIVPSSSSTELAHLSAASQVTQRNVWTGRTDGEGGNCSRYPPSSPQPLPLVKRPEPTRKPIQLEERDHIGSKTEPATLPCLRVVPFHQLNSSDPKHHAPPAPPPFDLIHSSSSASHSDDQETCGRKEQRNYKNMTRERRIEANARERTRVHTISAAFETLRRSVPSYSHNQKLSKLSVLRIACSYIATLSNIVHEEPEGNERLGECVETVSKTIQKEGKLRKKKDDSD